MICTVYGWGCRRMAAIATHVKVPMQSHGLIGVGGLLSHVALSSATLLSEGSTVLLFSLDPSTPPPALFLVYIITEKKPHSRQGFKSLGRAMVQLHECK
jgi:hypothetical protein